MTVDRRELHRQLRQALHAAGRAGVGDDAAQAAAGGDDLDAVDDDRVGERGADGVFNATGVGTDRRIQPDGEARRAGHDVLTELRDRGQRCFPRVVGFDDADHRDFGDRNRPLAPADVQDGRVAVHPHERAIHDAVVAGHFDVGARLDGARILVGAGRCRQRQNDDRAR